MPRYAVLTVFVQVSKAFGRSKGNLYSCKPVHCRSTLPYKNVIPLKIKVPIKQTSIFNGLTMQMKLHGIVWNKLIHKHSLGTGDAISNQ